MTEPNKKCCIEGCEDPIYAKGHCSRHYQTIVNGAQRKAYREANRDKIDAIEALIAMQCPGIKFLQTDQRQIFQDILGPDFMACVRTQQTKTPGQVVINEINVQRLEALKSKINEAHHQ
jgi:hypothetical protein